LEGVGPQRLLNQGSQAIHALPEVDRVKILVYDGTGLCLYSKRLEAGRFNWPSPAEGVVRLSSSQLATLLEGLAWHHLQPRPVRRPSMAW
jgi:transposase